MLGHKDGLMSGRNIRIARAGRALVAALMVGISFVLPARSAEGPPAPQVSSDSSLTNPVTVPLEFREIAFTISTTGVDVETQSVAYVREPDLGKAVPVRGRLKFDGSVKTSLPFLWLPEPGKLYLDLNRNDDLTDDPEGERSFKVPKVPGFGFRHGLFSKIPLAIPGESASYHALVDLNFSEYSGRLSVFSQGKSYWSGKAVLGGTEWEVGLVPESLNMRRPGAREHLVFRPWKERDEAFSIGDGSLVAFPMPKRLFAADQAYSVESQGQGRDQPLLRQVRFTPETVETGELTVAGRFLKRVLLTGGGRVVILDAPLETVHVPVGAYGKCEACLGTPPEIAFLKDSRLAITVSKESSTNLALGGPLTNSATLAQRGDSIEIDYQLLGAGGRAYSMSADYQHPPRFRVLQAGKQVGEGKFEFG
jgi:hypothetical protein